MGPFEKALLILAGLLAHAGMLAVGAFLALLFGGFWLLVFYVIGRGIVFGG